MALNDYVISLPTADSPPAALAWKDLSVTSRKGGKVLLNGVSGQLQGGLCAVMGPSGSGKSTLLNALALRLDPRTALAGSLRLNGKPYNSALLKKVSGYVMQDDLLNGQLTVEETLQYTAKLRCPPDFTSEQRQQRVEKAMADMGLRHVRDVIVGDPLNKGISGGERKRLCVAIELITEPKLLFLDEPTSGLDSVTALGLIMTLKGLAWGGGEQPIVRGSSPMHEQQQLQLVGVGRSTTFAAGGSSSRSPSSYSLSTVDGYGADPAAEDVAAFPEAVVKEETGLSIPTAPYTGPSKGCTIICTIHQPQSKIFYQFDQLILLQTGSIVYQGDPVDAMDHFSKMGYPCPAFTNPADHFMDLITVRMPVASTPGTAPVEPQDLMPNPEQLRAFYKGAEVDLSLGADKALLPIRRVVPWTRQYTVLLERAMKECIRKREVVLTQLVQGIVIAVLIGTVFLKIGTGQSSAVRRQPVLFFCVINQGIFAALVVINSFPSERLLVLRERAAGTYYASAYFLAKVTAELLVQLPIPVFFSGIVYWLVGLQASAAKFFIFCSFMVLCNVAATSLALMVSTWCRTVDMSVSVLPMMLELARLFGGFFLSPANLPAYFSWLDALSYVKYTYIGISLNELTGLVLTCTEAQKAAAGGKCPVATGEETISQLGLGKYSMGLCAGVLVVYIVVCRVVAYAGLRVVKW